MDKCALKEVYSPRASSWANRGCQKPGPLAQEPARRLGSLQPNFSCVFAAMYDQPMINAKKKSRFSYVVLLGEIQHAELVWLTLLITVECCFV